MSSFITNTVSVKKVYADVCLQRDLLYHPLRSAYLPVEDIKIITAEFAFSIRGRTLAGKK